jgi:NTP pyrophosphatase (non-canonical NTP hydrolase)
MYPGEIHAKLRAFVSERDWDKFHSPENLAKSISIEAAELLELYQWGRPADLELVKDELADVLTYCHLLAMKLNFDPDEIMNSKLEKTSAKYPVKKSKGKSTKYDRLQD